MTNATDTEHAAFVQKIEAFTRAHLVGKEAELDASPSLPLPAYKAFYESGLANWWVPKEYGGRGLTIAQSVDVVAALAYGDAGFASAMSTPLLATYALLIYGTEAQKEHYLRRIALEGAIGALAASEEHAGSNLLATETVVDKDGVGGFCINGTKYFSTNADFADFVVVLARGESSMHSLIVPRATSGVEMVKKWSTTGLRSLGAYSVRFADCTVPASSMMRGNGVRMVEAVTSAMRTMIASLGIGVSRRVRDVCLAYAQTKQVREQSLLDNPVFGAKLGQMEMDIDAMYVLCKHSGAEFDAIYAKGDAEAHFQRQGMLNASIMTKTHCGHFAWGVASEGSTMMGGLGFTEDVLVGKLLRDVRCISILEGGDDALRGLIYNRYVLPRVSGR